MKQPEFMKNELLRQWIEKAEEDFNVARYLMAGESPYISSVCFHAQQAAEKFMKAFLVNRQTEFPKTHNLGELLDIISKIEPDLASTLKDVTELNPYSVTARYPGDIIFIKFKEAEKSLELASKVRDTILKLLNLPTESDALKRYINIRDITEYENGS